MSSVHDFTAQTIHGQDADLADYAGKALLVVNVASECGLTPQYADLEALHRQYADQGLAVLGFPCNQFKGQEPGNEEQILDFCQTRYDVSFSLFSKIEVNGPNRHPLYAYLAGEGAAFPATSPGTSRNSSSTRTASRWPVSRPEPPPTIRQ